MTPAKSVTDYQFQLAKLTWPNRVGLAAGFDKDGVAISGLSRLGFGFLEFGAVTPLPQQGNPKPRLFRVKSDEAVVNRMGFNNQGIEALCRRLAVLTPIAPVRLGVNIGRNASTSNECAFQDYVLCFNALSSYIDFVTINVSSPNTSGLIDLQEEKRLANLLKKLVSARDLATQEEGKRIAIFVKISPDLTHKHLEVCTKTIETSGCDGIVATNTTNSRPGKAHKCYAELGGLSGKPLFQKSLDCVTQIRKWVSKDFAIIGVGGIFSGSDAEQMVAAGADLVQVYTGMVYRGPQLVTEIVSSLHG